MTSLIQRYIALRTLRGIGLAFFIVTGLILLIDFVEGMRNIGQDLGLSSLNVLYLTLLKTPSLIEQTIPFIVLFGTIGSFYSLNRNSELVVLRASGLSAWNFLAPAIFVTFTLGVIWATLFNPLASRTLQIYETSISASENAQPITANIWLKEGTETQETLIHAQSYDPGARTLLNVTFTQTAINTEGHFSFSTRLDAKSAELKGGGYWQLNDVIENTDDVLAGTMQHETLSIPTRIRLEDIVSQTDSNFIPPFWALPKEITRTRRAGFATVRLEMQLHKLISLPLSLVAMTFIAACVSMQLTRQGGTLRLLIIGTTIGFMVYFTNSIFNAFGESSALPVMVAAWAIPIMTFFLGASYLAKVEDG